MSSCEPTDEVRSIIRAMARAKVEEGFTDANAIVDEIHAAIQDHTPLWKNEIADIITGIGQPKRKSTKTELQERLTQLKRDLRETYHPKAAPKSPEERRNSTRQTQLKKQIADIQDQIKRQDFSKPERQPFQYDQATQKLQSDLAVAKREADKLMRKLEWQNKSRAAKVLDTVLAFHRASILSGLTVFEHLSGAVLWRLLGTPLEQAAGAILHHVPGVRGLSELAPTEGGGFQGNAQIEGLKHAFGAETLKDIRDKLVRGYSDKQARNKAPIESNHKYLEFVGHMHDALKTPAENAGYYRALVTATSQARKSMARDGMKPDEIDAAMQSPAMMARIEALAYGESKNAKLQGDNAVINAIRAFLGSISKQGIGGKAVAGLANYQMPILKIPTNLFAETTSYAAGITKALGALINHRGEKISPETADYVMRNLKKGLVGKALAIFALAFSSEFGALYDEQRKKKPGEPDYGDLRTPAGTISHHLLHSPAWSYMMAVALAKRVYDQQVKKGKGKAEATATAGLRAPIALVKDLPFVEAPAEFFRSIKDSEGAGDYAGKAVSELTTPQLLKQAAKATDSSTLPRKPKGFMQQLEVGVPGLRENVPTKQLKGMSLDQKLDYYDKMKPAEREKSGIVESIFETAKRQGSKLTDEQLKRVEAIQ